MREKRNRKRKNENRGRTFLKANRKNPTFFGAAKMVNNNYVKVIILLFNRGRERLNQALFFASVLIRLFNIIVRSFFHLRVLQ